METPKMKIAIHGYGEFEIQSITYGTDECGKPVDICLVATKDVVEDLLSKNLIGNYNEDAIEDEKGNLYWETLSGRLPSFSVINALNCRFWPSNNQYLFNRILRVRD